LTSNAPTQSAKDQDSLDDIRDKLFAQIDKLIEKTEWDMRNVLALPNPPAQALREAQHLLDGLARVRDQLETADERTIGAIAWAIAAKD